MADIQTITLPDGNQYNFRDTRAELATASRAGIVKPDGTTITISGDGTISAAGGSSDVEVIAETATLTVAGWANNTQTINIADVTSNNNVIVSYAPASKDDYTAADIYCSGQGEGTITFTCSATPTSAITVNVLIINS